ncbi:MAG: acetylornithine transaminase [Nitrospirota bacterium]
MDKKTAVLESQKYLMNTYRRFPVLLRKGRGMKVWGPDGREFLDFVGGVATNVLGHCHPKVVVAIQKQAQRLIHVSNFYHIEPQIELARLLVENSFAEKVFFCNSGAEANEGAIKLARKFSAVHYAPEKREIIAAHNAFHGRTLATLAATGQEKFQKGFEPLTPGFRHVPFGDADALARAVTDRTCAVMLEPIQGEAGVQVPPEDYLKKVELLCRERGLLFILDEVQTGMGRTGTLFACEQYGVEPDIMTLAKGLGGGVPIGAVLATGRVAEAFAPGDHGSTFGGNPLACAAAVATLQTVLESGFLLEQCRRMGAYLSAKLQDLKRTFSSTVADVRGKGLLLGMELTRDCGPVVEACLQRGLLLNCAAGNVLRFMPPLIVQEGDIDQMAQVLGDVMERLP